MKYQLLVSLFCLSFSIFSQSSFPKSWKTEKTIKLFGHEIKREFGNARATPYIFFKTLEQLEQETKEEAKTHYWTADSLENHLTHLRKYQGGVIGVKLVANTVKAANTKNLRMIIQDSEGNEIQRQLKGEHKFKPLNKIEYQSEIEELKERISQLEMEVKVLKRKGSNRVDFSDMG